MLSKYSHSASLVNSEYILALSKTPTIIRGKIRNWTGFPVVCRHLRPQWRSRMDMPDTSKIMVEIDNQKTGIHYL